MTSFSGKTIVLTGVGRAGQLGETVAQSFAAQGASTILVSRAAAEVEQRAESIRSAGGLSTGFPCDLSDHAQVAAVATRIHEQANGRIDALVNLAGGFAMTGPIADSDVAGWDRQLSINLDTAYAATRAFLPLLRRAAGSIVYVASASALPGASTSGMSAYIAAKTAVLSLMRAVAEEERAHGVRANAVATRTIRTSANTSAMGNDARYVEREDVAAAILFLCSDAARAVSGVVMELG